jgi:GTP-binding protein
VVATKADLVEDPSTTAQALGAHAETVVVSGETGEGVELLTARLAELVRRSRAVSREPYVILRPGRERFSVRRDGNRFRVEGPSVERWVTETDFEDEDSVAQLQRKLRKEGVERRLAAEGARRGDEVLIAGTAFEFHPDEDGG